MNSNAGGSDEGGSIDDAGAEETTFLTAEESHSSGDEDDTDAHDVLNSYPLDEEEPTLPAAADGSESGDKPEASIDDIPEIGFRTPQSGSPLNSGSIPDDTPSVRGSPFSSPIRGTLSPRGSVTRTPSGALQPFERRFQSRFSASPSPSPRVASPAFLTTHSRQSSITSQIPSQEGDVNEAPQAPWEVVRWTRLRKITGQAFSEAGKRQFGLPTCMAVSASIVLGTSKGLILVFDYHQTLKGIIGQGTRATECGAITAIAVSADYTTIAGGHISGHIFTWEIAKPAKPFLHVPPLQRSGQHQTQAPDGHVPDRAVMHVGFLGTRHTALVSADDGGMAFSHLATRGLGAVARSVKTVRLLGRYPAANIPTEPPRKPSSVLAFAPLPLGNVEQATDGMGLTALLTPYLLVVVSTTPIAQTQHKASRPKDLAPHGALSGCLAWFPAVRLKVPAAGKEISDTKLVYTWSDVLTVLEVEIGQQDAQNPEKQPILFFRPRSRWKCEEAIVGVQWLSRSVIGVLTISQRLIVLEDGSLNVMDSVDLLQKHIYHRDVFSGQLQSAVEQSEDESAMHGVVADAFFMSYRVYKGRLFLLGFTDVSVGTLSNWADRLAALVEHGDDIAAIRLAISYYNGDIGKVSVGLPEEPGSRHDMVREKLIELLTASLQYRFSRASPQDGRLKELTAECFDACVTMDEVSFLLDDIYDMYSTASEAGQFVETLEIYILDGEITSLPPALVQDIVHRYVSNGQAARLEELLCRLDAHTFDVDQINRLCKGHLLYDALIYLWNQALLDWVTPLVELLNVVKDVNSDHLLSDSDTTLSYGIAMKIFPYLAFSLTGRVYPKGESMDDNQGDLVKGDLYRYLFSHEIAAWPPGSTSILRTHIDSDDEPAFPYLQLLLDFDSSSFMSMLNEAFEDPFLNEQEQDSPHIGSSSLDPVSGSATKITRQHIVSILLDIMSGPDYGPEQTIYLDMFIARSLPKYPQFMILSGSSLQHIMHRLCTHDSEDLADDCQLSVEYLLSVYHPPVTLELTALLKDARFYRILKSVYRAEGQYVNLVRTYFEDQFGRDGIFADLADALHAGSVQSQRAEIEGILCEHATELAFINIYETVRTISLYGPDLLVRFVDALEDSRLRFTFLRTLLEPSLVGHPERGNPRISPAESTLGQFREQYVQLMCEHDPEHVSDFVSLLKSGDLRLDKVLPSLEENGVIDAAILLLAQDGLARDSMERLVKHMHALQNALSSLIAASSESPDATNAQEAATHLVEAIEKYSRLGIWLCEGQTRIVHRSRHPRPRKISTLDVKEDDLELDEYLWLNLVDLIVGVVKEVNSEAVDVKGSIDGFDVEKITNALRAIVQQTFTVLLSTTTAAEAPRRGSAQQASQPRARIQTSQSFLRIFRAFLTRATLTAPSLSDLRAVLLDIFSAYAYESDVLNLATQLLDRDTFVEIDELHGLRQRGWRPRAQVCEQCKRRAWGPGIGERVWDEWTRTEEQRALRRKERAVVMGAVAGDERGKGKKSLDLGTGEPRTPEEEAERNKMVLVVFACRHVFHRTCLESMRAAGEPAGMEGKFACPLCDEKKK